MTMNPGGTNDIKSLPPGISTTYINESKNNHSKNIPVDIFVPKGKVNGDVLVLPGWNFNRKLWYQNTKLLSLAEKNGLRLIFPEMSKTLYESKYFPETTLKWSLTPGGQWIQNIFLPAMLSYGIFINGNNNYIMGLSTGGRGVAIISLNNPGLFKAGASLSGDFDQSKMPEDKLMTAVYGNFQNHKIRWETVDNPQSKIDEWIMPIYLGHGEDDHLVPPSQSINFCNAIKKAHPNLEIKCHFPEKYAHDWKYWSSEIENIIQFFLKLN